MSQSTIVDPDGNATSDPRPLNLKRLIFDWSSVAAIVAAVLTYAALAGDVKTNARDIVALNTAESKRRGDDVQAAATMATRADVQRVENKIDALASELRSARAASR